MRSNRLVTALDVGSAKVSCVIANVHDNNTCEVLGVSTVPSRGIKKGVVVNLDEAVNAIAQAINAAERMADITVASLVVNISGKLIKSVNNKGVIAITRGEVSPEDVLRAVDQAKTIPMPSGEEILHIIPREFIIDSQPGIRYPVGMSGSRLEVDTHIVLAPSTVLKNVAKCIQQLGIDVEGVVFNGWADNFSVLTETEKELGVSLLDIGAGTTDIIIFQEGSVAYSGCIPVGGLNITNDLAVGLHISLEDAEKLKLKYKDLVNQPTTPAESIDTPSFQKLSAKDDKKEEKKKEEPKASDDLDITSLHIEGVTTISRELLERIVTVRLQEIFELAKAEVARAGFDLAMPAGVVMVGGTAKMSGLTALAKSYLRASARIGTPHGLTGMVEEITGPEYATVQGMVKYALTNEESLSSVSSGKPNSPVVDRVRGWFKSLMP